MSLGQILHIALTQYLLALVSVCTIKPRDWKQLTERLWLGTVGQTLYSFLYLKAKDLAGMLLLHC